MVVVVVVAEGCVLLGKGKEKRPILHWIVKSGVFLCGMDGTRTRDPMRDRHVF